MQLYWHAPKSLLRHPLGMASPGFSLYQMRWHTERVPAIVVPPVWVLDTTVAAEHVQRDLDLDDGPAVAVLHK